MQDISQAAEIKAMPTFFFFSDGQRVDDLVGANPQALKSRIDELKRC